MAEARVFEHEVEPSVDLRTEAKTESPEDCFRRDGSSGSLQGRETSPALPKDQNETEPILSLTHGPVRRPTPRETQHLIDVSDATPAFVEPPMSRMLMYAKHER